jgi:biopolymer transport protein ExbB
MTLCVFAFAQPVAAQQPNDAKSQMAPATPVAPPMPPAATTPVTSPQPAIPAPLNAQIGTEPAPGGVAIGTGLHELSPWSMFMNADIIVKAVMIGLAFASAVTWTVFLAKSFELSAAAARLKSSLRKIANARSLGEAQTVIGQKHGVVASLLAAALHEVSLSEDCLSEPGIKDRAASSFSEVVKAEARGIRRGTGLLATIGATAPFVGLFGTVWGIMNSFIGISKAQTTNLAVVAPGIAEALLATAIGLVAAIPAVVIYNHFSRTTKTYLDLVSGASGAVARLLSRDLDRRSASMSLEAGE